MRVVDTRGEKCPRPIIETRKALKETAAGEVFAVLTDNRTSFNNISRFLSDNKIKFTVSESQGVWKFEVNSSSGNIEMTTAEDYCESAPPAGNYTVAITSEVMGSGDDDLGRKLMKSFFVSLSVLEPRPSAMVFYNAGVKLATSDSGISDFLVELEKSGVEILLCGTCVDYFNIGGKLVTGKIVDMYYIVGKLSASGNVIRP
jgi:selenium metabolism protein YedF